MILYKGIEKFQNVNFNMDCLEGLRLLPDESIDTCVTSPPYYALRDYGAEGQIGLEETPEQFIEVLVGIFSEVKRVLKNTGTLWVNIGDTYASAAKDRTESQVMGRSSTITGAESQMAGMKQQSTVTGSLKRKDLIGIPWMLAFALRNDGWFLRQDIIWSKTDPMPESVKDRCTKSHEYIFLLSKSSKYYFNHEAIKEESTSGIYKHAWGRAIDGSVNDVRKGSGSEVSKKNGGVQGTVSRSKRSVWPISTFGYPDAHFATFPEKLIVDPIKAGCPEWVCDKCGSPYIEEIQKELVPTAKASFNSKVDARDIGADKNDMGSNLAKDGHQPGWAYKSRVVDTKPSCECKGGKVPGIVLDPFNGVATTSIVSRKLNRNYVGFELNEKYWEMGEVRIKKELGLFT